MHCNLRLPMLQQSLSTVFTMSMPGVKSHNLSVAVLLSFHWWYLRIRDLDLSPRDLDLRPWTLSCIACQILAKSINLQQSCSNFNVWPCDHEHISRVELCCDIISTKFKLCLPIRSWHVTIFADDILCHTVILTEVHSHWVTRWPWRCVVHQVSFDRSLYEIWAKLRNL